MDSLEISSNPLCAQQVCGRSVTAAALLGKDAKYEGATFTAQMQPLIQPGEQVCVCVFMCVCRYVCVCVDRKSVV